MASFDTFAGTLLEEAKRFLEKATEAAGDSAAQTAYLHAALNLGFASAEAHMNAVAEEVASHSEFSAPHDQGVLLEKEVRLEEGRFRLKGSRFYPLEDRITFLHVRIKGKLPDKQSQWWSDLKTAISLRNKLTHPKSNAPDVNIANVTAALSAVIAAVNAIYKAVYSKPFPLAARGLQSKLTF